jgi:WD40 repeat protein
MQHEDWVNSASFSPDGTRVVTTSQDKSARLWSVPDGKPLGEPMRHEDAVWSARFSPDGTRIVTCSQDKTARLWNAANGKPLGEPMRHEGTVWSASFSPDGARIVTASQDMTARLWNAASGKAQGEPMRHDGMVTNASFSPDGTHIVTASSDKTARLWDAATHASLGEPMRHQGAVTRVSFSPDGKYILTASADHSARLWDSGTSKLLGEPFLHEAVVVGASFSSDGTRILTASNDKTARLWELKSLLGLPAEPPEWVREWARAVAGLTFNADGVMQSLPAEDRVRILYAPHDRDDPWARLARWVAADPAKRTIHPDSPHTCREIAERERDYGTKESLESALRYDPTVPLARLLLAKFEENPQRAGFLRDYDLQRLPDDAALWARAAKVLAEQHDPERAKRALDKLGTRDAERARTLKTELGL